MNFTSCWRYESFSQIIRYGRYNLMGSKSSFSLNFIIRVCYDASRSVRQVCAVRHSAVMETDNVVMYAERPWEIKRGQTQNYHAIKKYFLLSLSKAECETCETTVVSQKPPGDRVWLHMPFIVFRKMCIYQKREFTVKEDISHEVWLVSQVSVWKKTSVTHIKTNVVCSMS